VFLRAGSLIEVEAYLYEKVLRPSAIVKDVPAGAAALPVAPDSMEAFKARLAEIDEPEKPYDTTAPLMSTWLGSRPGSSRGSRAAGRLLQASEEAGEEHPAAGAGGQCDLFGPLLDALRSELAGGSRTFSRARLTSL
jgi:hypothetical protein